MALFPEVISAVIPSWSIPNGQSWLLFTTFPQKWSPILWHPPPTPIDKGLGILSPLLVLRYLSHPLCGQMHAHTSLSRGWAGARGSQISDPVHTLQHESVQRAANSQTIHKLCHGNMGLHRCQWSYDMTSVQEEKLDTSCQCCMRKYLLIQKKDEPRKLDSSTMAWQSVEMSLLLAGPVLKILQSWTVQNS